MSETPVPVTRRWRDADDGALSAGFLAFLVTALAGILFFTQLGHANVLATEATTAADAAALGAVTAVRDHIASETHLGGNLDDRADAICARSRSWARQNNARVIDCDVTFQFLRQQLAVEVTVRGNDGPVAGVSDQISDRRPESRSRAELRYRFVNWWSPLEPDIALAPVGGSTAWKEAPTLDINDILPGGGGPVPPSAEGITWPLCFPVTSEFGPRWGRMHTGIDQGMPEGSNVHAALDGTIVRREWAGGYGNLVVIRHDDGVETYYAHLSAFGPPVGTRVEQGEVIALSGNTGNSTGPHLHFETRVNGVPRNPRDFLGPGPPRC